MAANRGQNLLEKAARHTKSRLELGVLYVDAVADLVYRVGNAD
jgi:hypothetical protein